MGIEKYIAIASLGLYIMFVGEILTLYDFMIEPRVEVEPEPKVLQYISIGIAPAVILTGTSFIMAKRYGSKPIGAMIISGGIILLVGMFVAQLLLDEVEPVYLVQAVTLTPPLFMIVSIPVMIVGAVLLKIKKQRPKKEYF
jgi:RsiW-degrading membrane proteinase PrsW (M82 family)